MGKRFLLFLSLTLLFITSVALAQSAKVGTITVKSGDLYESVSFTVDHYYKVIKITADGKKKTVSITDIVMITNSSGDDITEKSLGKSYYLVKKSGAKPESAPSQTLSDTAQTAADTTAFISDTVTTPSDTAVTAEPIDSFTTGDGSAPTTAWKSKTDIAHNKRAPYLSSVCLRIHADYGSPGGPYYEGIDDGFGGGADISIPVGDEIAIWAQVGKVGMSLSLPVNEFKFSAWSYMLGVEFLHFAQGRAEQTCFPSMYVFTGIGSISHSATGSPYGVRRTYSESKFALSLGVGTVLPAGKTVGIDVGAKLFAMYGRFQDTPYPSTSQVGITGTVIQMYAGLAIAIK